MLNYEKAYYHLLRGLGKISEQLYLLKSSNEYTISMIEREVRNLAKSAEFVSGEIAEEAAEEEKIMIKKIPKKSFMFEGIEIKSEHYNTLVESLHFSDFPAVQTKILNVISYCKIVRVGDLYGKEVPNIRYFGKACKEKFLKGLRELTREDG